MAQLAQHEHHYETFITDKFTFKIHKNGILVLFLTQSFVKTLGKINSVVYQKHDLDQIVGKNKHNAHFTQNNETLITINDIQIKSPVSFKLLEQNMRLIAEPGLIENDSQRTGYIAIFAPKWHRIEDLRKVLRKLQNGEEMNEDELKVLQQFE